MTTNAPKGLALTGSILAIVVGSLALIGGLLALAGRGPDFLKVAGVIALGFGIAGVVLGGIGCTIKPGPILANAIVFSVLTLFGLIGLSSGRAHPVLMVGLLLEATTTVFLYVGFAQARRYQAALRDQASAASAA
ncbi:MAG: hypothetical protein U1F43_00670 [Myxococcota bacterium]